MSIREVVRHWDFPHFETAILASEGLFFLGLSVDCFHLQNDEEKLKKAADLLKDVLLSVCNNSNSNTISVTIASTAETLLQATSMKQTSTDSGLYCRLNRNEQLRVATVSMRNKKSKSKPLEKKPNEFASLRANSEESNCSGERLINITLSVGTAEHHCMLIFKFLLINIRIGRDR